MVSSLRLLTRAGPLHVQGLGKIFLVLPLGNEVVDGIRLLF